MCAYVCECVHVGANVCVFSLSRVHGVVFVSVRVYVGRGGGGDGWGSFCIEWYLVLLFFLLSVQQYVPGHGHKVSGERGVEGRKR